MAEGNINGRMVEAMMGSTRTIRNMVWEPTLGLTVGGTLGSGLIASGMDGGR
jgi:hypothetical protein